MILYCQVHSDVQLLDGVQNVPFIYLLGLNLVDIGLDELDSAR